MGSLSLFFFVDMEDIKIFAKGQNATEADELNLWDVKFWSERLRESSYHINEVGLCLSLSLFVCACIHACVCEKIKQMLMDTLLMNFFYL